MPVSKAPGTMNRICEKIENEFQTTNVLPDVEFDPSILKSDALYSQEEFEAVNVLYDEYGKAIALLCKNKHKNDTDGQDIELDMLRCKQSFVERCCEVCPNYMALTNIIIDVCYSSNKSKSFAWDICGNEIFNNVLHNSENKIQFPVKDENGDIEFCGKKFSLCTKKVGDKT